MNKKSNYFEKINKSSVVQQVIDSLTKAMIDKELRPGDKIPTELELSEALGVGRLSIREAIKVLVYFGVLEIRRPEGTFVCEGFSEAMIDPMIYGIILDTDDSYTHLAELRQMIEVGVIKLAIKKSTEKSLQILMDKYKDFENVLACDPVSVQAVFDVDNEFHQIVSQMGGNPLIEKINSLVRVLTHSLRYNTVENMISLKKTNELLAAHKAICDIIVNKDTNNIDTVIEHGYFYGYIDVS